MTAVRSAPAGLRAGSAASPLAPRLTAGWQHGGGGLRAHLETYGPLPRRSGRPGALIDRVRRAGLTGRGGAGFPAGTKMAAVAARRGPAVVVANGMEGEPASGKDQALLARAPHLVLDGAVAAAEAVGAGVVHLCVPRARRWLAGQLAAALAERRQAGLDAVAVELRQLPHHYVASEESALVRWLNGGAAVPSSVPPRPFERGVGRQPTLAGNVETLAHIALIARYGPDWFRQAGLPHAPGTMLATISGAVAGPGVYELELGTPVGEVLALSGAHGEARHLLLGGYFGTWCDIGRIAGLPLSEPDLAPAGAAPGAGVMVVLPPDRCGLAETARVLAWLAAQSAGQCGPCTFGLPAVAGDFAQLAAGRPQGRLTERLDRRLGVIGGRGACRHPDGAVRLAASALTAFAADVRAHLTRRCLHARHGASPAPVLPVPGRCEQDGEP